MTEYKKSETQITVWKKTRDEAKVICKELGFTWNMFLKIKNQPISLKKTYFPQTRKFFFQRVELLQNLSNSVIQSLARHHRVLICYYHNDKQSQETIKKLANIHIGMSSV